MKKMVSRVLAFLLAFIMIFGLVAVAARADAALSGRAGGDAVWSFDPDTGVFTVSGLGVMFDYDGVDYRPWAAYTHQIRTIVVKEGITALGRNAFFDCSVEAVEFPSTLLRIAAGTFKHCPDLKSIDLSGSSIRGIEKQAFANCPALVSVVLPNSVPGGIWYDAFNGDSSLTNVTAGGNSELADRVLNQARVAADRPVYPVQFTAFSGVNTFIDAATGDLITEYWHEGEIVMVTVKDGTTAELWKVYYSAGEPVRGEYFDAAGNLLGSWKY